MKLEELDILLRENNAVEESEVTEDQQINETIHPYHRLEVPKISREPFFINGSIFINKHYNCPEMTSHTHDFVEINYMYAGQCTQQINGKQIILKQGQLLLMDKDVVQSIDDIGEDDILINILLQDESIATDIISNFVKSQSLVSEFLLHASRDGEEHNNFLFFDTTENEKIQILLKSLIAEFYGKERHMNQSLKLYISLIFIELTKVIERQSIEKYSQNEPEIIFILKFIETNYADISLESLAKEFGYNKNYLGSRREPS